jgi:hypothetical protein
MNGTRRGFKPISVDLWEMEDESTCAAPVSEWSADEVLAAYRIQYGLHDKDSWYCGIETVRLPKEDGQLGRWRRAHIVSADFDARGNMRPAQPSEPGRE